MDVTPEPLTNNCRAVREILSRVGDKWSIQVVVSLRAGPQRFNALKRAVEGISQQMLARTLKALEREGLIERTVLPDTPPRVEYALTPLGHSLSQSVRILALWAEDHAEEIAENRARYDAGE